MTDSADGIQILSILSAPTLSEIHSLGTIEKVVVKKVNKHKKPKKAKRRDKITTKQFVSKAPKRY